MVMLLRFLHHIRWLCLHPCCCSFVKDQDIQDSKWTKVACSAAKSYFIRRVLVLDLCEVRFDASRILGSEKDDKDSLGE